MTHNGEIIVIVDGQRMTLDEFTQRKQERVSRFIRYGIPVLICLLIAGACIYWIGKGMGWW